MAERKCACMNNECKLYIDSRFAELSHKICDIPSFKETYEWTKKIEERYIDNSNEIEIIKNNIENLREHFETKTDIMQEVMKSNHIEFKQVMAVNTERIDRICDRVDKTYEMLVEMSKESSSSFWAKLFPIAKVNYAVVVGLLVFVITLFLVKSQEIVSIITKWFIK